MPAGSHAARQCNAMQCLYSDPLFNILESLRVCNFLLYCIVLYFVLCCVSFFLAIYARCLQSF